LVTRKVLITGISGFVGPYLARNLLDSGHDVYGFVSRRADGQKPVRLAELSIQDEIKLINGDITDLTSVLSAVQTTEPDWIFHLAAQSYIPESFRNPLSTFRVNCLGTQNLLEAIRLRDLDSRLIFAGSSEEYGLQFRDENHFEQLKQKYGEIEPYPSHYPEIPVDEEGALRPMSPYATSKVFGDFAFRNYHKTFGLNTIVSRAFNHEGAGRGPNFVTSTIVRQLVLIHLNQLASLEIGDIESFRDWSHVEDIVSGYEILAEKADAGSVYVQGSMRSNSVLSYILYGISTLGYDVEKVETLDGNKRFDQPLKEESLEIGEFPLLSNSIDKALLLNNIHFCQKDKGLRIVTPHREFKIRFDPSRYRSSDVPVLMSNIHKISKLGFTVKHALSDIINDQINYYLNPINRVNKIYD
jgi:GDP-mannose 4,6-dehydratase